MILKKKKENIRRVSMQHVVLNPTTFAFKLLQPSNVEACVLEDLGYRFGMFLLSLT